MERRTSIATSKRPLPLPLLPLLLLLSVLQLTLVATARQTADGASRSRRLEQISGKDIVTLNLVHFNDVHNRIEAQTTAAAYCSIKDDDAGKCFGGYARIRSVIRYAKSLDPSTLILDAGDEFVGSLYDTMLHGKADANLGSLYGVDAMTVGNHEFDFGPSALAEFVRRVNFPVLGACNIDASKEPALANLLKRYVIKEVKGIKIAIYGILTNVTALTSSPGPNIVFSDPFQGLAACIKQANEEHRGIHLHVALTHIGYDQDQLLAAQIKGLDLIVGGHSHTFLYTGTPPLLTASVNTSHDIVEGPYPTFVNYTSPSGKTKTVPIVQAYFASRYVGALQLLVDKKRGGLVKDESGTPIMTGQPLLLGGNHSSSTVSKDAVMSELVALYSGQISTFSETIIGSSLVELDNAPTRTTESLIGDLSCDAFINTTVYHDGQIDFCILNGGTIRDSLHKGPISVGQVFTVYPFSNTIGLIQMNGSAIIGSLEWGTSAVGTTTGTGRFPQVGGGLRFVYDARKPVGQRILSVKTKSGADIDPCAQYVVLTNSYQATGGDGYAFMNDSPKLELYGRPFDAALTDYVKAYTPVSAQLDGRIIACHLDPSNAACVTSSPHAAKGVVTATPNPPGSIIPYTMAIEAAACAKA